MNRRERRAAGATGRAPTSPSALCEAGLGHLRAGRLLDAQLCCERVLAIDPDCADALHLAGLLSLQAGQYDHALEWVTRALRRDTKPDYLATLGAALQQLGRLDEAFRAFDLAVQLKPDVAEFWRIRGNCLLALKRHSEAGQDFERVLALAPHHWEAAYNSGILLHDAGRLEEAVARFTLCIELRPDHALSWYLRGRSLNGLQRFDEALADNERAHALDPDDADICNNIGGILLMLRRDAEALGWFDKALGLQPDNFGALRNKAVLLTDHHRFDEAFALHAHLQALDPGNAGTEWNLSHLQLLTGDFAAGWKGREARWRVAGLSLARIQTSAPLWLGKEPIAGKTILINADEGLGDAIQFVRYVPMVAALGARVILMVPGALSELLANLSGVSECVVIAKDAPPACDAHSPISSLPLAFGTTLETIPSAARYLPVPKQTRLETWQNRLGPHDRFRVGLVWAGNPRHKNDHNRSLPLRALSSILDCDATFISLQKDPRPDDQAVLGERVGIVDLTADLTDFAETAALIACLDLVITVDTSVAHLSAAMGCPTWILLPYTPDYRWLLDRDDSPWYSSARLFRQDARRDYAEVIDRLRAQLIKTIAAGRDRAVQSG